MIQNAKEEIMQMLIEECSEVTKCVTKIERFDHVRPPEKRNKRLDHLKEEIVDVIGVIALLFDELEISPEEESRLYTLGKAKMKKRYENMTFQPKTPLKEMIGE